MTRLVPALAATMLLASTSPMKDPRGDGRSDGAHGDVYVGVGQSSLVHGAVANHGLGTYLLKYGADTLAIEIADVPSGYQGDWPTTAGAVIARLQITP